MRAGVYMAYREILALPCGVPSAPSSVMWFSLIHVWWSAE
jgi:hypothetical protein